MILKVGDSFEIVKTFSKDEVEKFAELSQDNNPVHLDEIYAKSTIFKRCVIHGAFISSYFSTILGTKLPGPGTIYLSQTTRFLKPVFINDQIKIRVEVTEIRANKAVAILRTYCVNNDNELIVDGEAVVKYPI